MWWSNFFKYFYLEPYAPHAFIHSTPRPKKNPQKIKMKKKQKKILDQGCVELRTFRSAVGRATTELWQFEIPPRLITAQMAMLYQEVYAGITRPENTVWQGSFDLV
jgi:hypothetical protein